MQASGGCEVGYRDCATRVAELLRFHFGATGAAATTLADDEADRIFTIAGANKVLGFVADALPSDRKPIALRMNDGGWSTQIDNIRTHVEA